MFLETVRRDLMSYPEDAMLEYAERVVSHLPGGPWLWDRDGDRVGRLAHEDCALQVIAEIYPRHRLRWEPDWPTWEDTDGRSHGPGRGAGFDPSQDFSITTGYTRHPKRTAADVHRRLVSAVEPLWPGAAEWAREQSRDAEDRVEFANELVEMATKGWPHAGRDSARVTLDFGDVTLTAEVGARNVFENGSWGTDGMEVRIDRLSLPEDLARKVFAVLRDHAKETRSGDHSVQRPQVLRQ